MTGACWQEPPPPHLSRRRPASRVRVGLGPAAHLASSAGGYAQATDCGCGENLGHMARERALNAHVTSSPVRPGRPCRSCTASAREPSSSPRLGPPGLAVGGSGGRVSAGSTTHENGRLPFIVVSLEPSGRGQHGAPGSGPSRDQAGAPGGREHEPAQPPRSADGYLLGHDAAQRQPEPGRPRPARGRPASARPGTPVAAPSSAMRAQVTRRTRAGRWRWSPRRALPAAGPTSRGFPEPADHHEGLAVPEGGDRWAAAATRPGIVWSAQADVRAENEHVARRLRDTARPLSRPVVPRRFSWPSRTAVRSRGACCSRPRLGHPPPPSRPHLVPLRSRLGPGRTRQRPLRYDLNPPC